MARIEPSVRVTETYSETNFLRLHTASDGPGPDARLVTLEHLSYSARGATETARGGWRCETIVDREPMSREDALFIADSYARENGIPVIYECHSD